MTRDDVCGAMRRVGLSPVVEGTEVAAPCIGVRFRRETSGWRGDAPVGALHLADGDELARLRLHGWLVAAIQASPPVGPQAA